MPWVCAAPIPGNPPDPTHPAPPTSPPPQGTRKLSFSQFLSALERLAAERGVPKEALHELVASCAGPTLNSAMTPVEVDSESGRLLSRAASGSPAGSSSSLHGAAAAVAAAVEAAGSPHQVEEQEQEEVVESLAVGVDKL